MTAALTTTSSPELGLGGGADSFSLELDSFSLNKILDHQCQSSGEDLFFSPPKFDCVADSSERGSSEQGSSKDQHNISTSDDNPSSERGSSEQGSSSDHDHPEGTHSSEDGGAPPSPPEEQEHSPILDDKNTPITPESSSAAEGSMSSSQVSACLETWLEDMLPSVAPAAEGVLLAGEAEQGAMEGSMLGEAEIQSLIDSAMAREAKPRSSDDVDFAEQVAAHVAQQLEEMCTAGGEKSPVDENGRLLKAVDAIML